MTLVARISRSALEHNLRTLSARSSPAAVMLIVKANAYGHGTTDVSKVAYESGIRHFGCLEIETALTVRTVVPDHDAMLLAWQFSNVDDLSRVAHERIDLGVGSEEQLDFIEAAYAAGSGPIRVQLKVDTGLNRNGMSRAGWDDFVARAVRMELTGAITVAGVWTHIAETSDDHDERARREFESARAVLEAAVGRPLFAHLAASSASFRLADFRYDAVRIGGHAYGIPSFNNISPAEMDLIPVMTLVGSAEADLDDEWGPIAIVAGGFADGVPGYAAGKTHVTVNGVRHAIQAVLEDEILAGGAPSGAEVYLFGDGSHGEQTVREWGDAIGTLGDEITCRISASVTRRVVD